MIPTFDLRTRELVFNGQNGFCLMCLDPMTEIHHRMPNTKTNRKLFPKFLQSIFNAAGLCRDCHVEKTHDPVMRLSYDQAKAYEEWLDELE